MPICCTHGARHTLLVKLPPSRSLAVQACSRHACAPLPTESGYARLASQLAGAAPLNVFSVVLHAVTTPPPAAPLEESHGLMRMRMLAHSVGL